MGEKERAGHKAGEVSHDMILLYYWTDELYIYELNIELDLNIEFFVVKIDIVQTLLVILVRAKIQIHMSSESIWKT